MKAIIISIVLLGLLGAGTLLAASPASTSRTLNIDTLVEGWKGQVELLRWVGGAVVAGLVTAVGILWCALQTAQKERAQVAKDLRDRLLNVTKEHADSNRRLADSLDQLRTNCEARGK